MALKTSAKFVGFSNNEDIVFVFQNRDLQSFNVLDQFFIFID